jgi:hypothetical protein
LRGSDGRKAVRRRCQQTLHVVSYMRRLRLRKTSSG